MMLVTTDEVPGRRIATCMGLVRGSAVRASHVIADLMAKMKNLVGGELEEYTKLLAEAREQSLDRMIAEAAARGADAIIGIRFVSTEITNGAAEFLVYGTAVKLVPPAAPA